MKSKDYIIIGSAIAIYLLWKNSKTKTTTKSISGGGATGSGIVGSGAIVSGTNIVPTSNEPEQIFGLTLPSGMDLPVLTAGNGTPTEVGVQQGLGNTTPTPILTPIKEVSTEDVLILGGIRPIARDEIVKTEVYDGTPIIRQDMIVESTKF
jgi:hypothetical protein